MPTPPPRRPRRDGDRRQPDDRHQRGGERSARGDGKRRSITSVRTGALPKWVRDEVTRTTPKDRREAALKALADGVRHYSEDRYPQALTALRQAKALSPRVATIRELIGLSAYHAGRWDEALRELRTYRRLAGDTTHMPVEMDCLRALGRSQDVAKTWELFRELGGARGTEDEARVVYASHLLDMGRPREAWEVIRPGRLVPSAPESTLRRWFVAARVAAAAGDVATARTLVNAIRKQDPDLPGLSDLEERLT